MKMKTGFHFKGWAGGCWAEIEPWYKDDFIYVNIKTYDYGARVSSPKTETSYLFPCEYESDFENHLDRVIRTLNLFGCEKYMLSKYVGGKECTM